MLCCKALLKVCFVQGKDAHLMRGQGLDEGWQAVFQETDAAIVSDDGCTATVVLVWREAAGQICLQVRLSSFCACYSGASSAKVAAWHV